jgi:hypothetical protein
LIPFYPLIPLVFLVPLLSPIREVAMEGKMKRCCICRASFQPHRKVGKRQKTCGDPDCQRILKKNNNARWWRKNPDYGKNDYSRIKACLEKNPGYLVRYRREHPEYVQKNRDAQKYRDKTKRLHLDIQAKLSRQPSKIIEQSMSFPEVAHLDIQDEFILEPLEITFFLSRFCHATCLDIQDKMDFAASIPDNGAIKPGGGAYGCTMAYRS